MQFARPVVWATYDSDTVSDAITKTPALGSFSDNDWCDLGRLLNSSDPYFFIYKMVQYDLRKSVNYHTRLK